MILYKYRTPISFRDDQKCNTLRILINSELFYAKPSSFNDPYEAHVEMDISASKEQAIASHFRVLRERERIRNAINPVQTTWLNATKNVEKIYEKVLADSHIDHQRYYKDTMDHFGVLSLCSERNNLLLWAHYASEHRGICFGLDWERTGLPEAQEVNYQTRYKKIDYWSHTEDEIAKIACMQKSIDWSYEKEWRSISASQYEFFREYHETDECLREINAAKEKYEYNAEYFINEIKNKYTYTYRRPVLAGSRPLRFKKESLREVIFGSRMSKESIRAHIEYIEFCGYAPKYFLATQNRQSYSLDIKELTI